MSKFFLYIIPPIVWAVIIFMLSTNSPVDVGPVDWLDFVSIDKVGHLVFYCVFCCLVCWSFFKIKGQANHLSMSSAMASIAIVVIYGVIMEFLQQGFYAGRQLEFMDMIANAIGAVLGAFLFKKFLVSWL